MSLLVNVRVYDKNGEYSEIELEKGKDLAGFERSRYKLYGSDLAESFGFKLLPELKQNDLYVEAQKLDELENELNTIIENVEQFSEVAEYEREYVMTRVQNILDAVQIAKKVNGVIVVW